MRPSHLTINLSHLAHNFGLIRNFVHPAKITAVVKANAYGHGLIPCAKCFEKAGADFIGVAFIEEGIELRDAGITCPIIALAGISGRQAELFLEYDIDCVVSSISKLIHVEEVAKKNKKKARIHLKIDTGMGRIGVHYQSEQLPGLIARSINSDYLECIGISTHLSESESEDTSYTGLQIERFHSSLDPFINDLSQSTLLHVANSGATLSNRNSHLSMVRPGRILYGIPPAPHLSSVLDLKPCLSLKSEVVYFKVAKKGSPISYGRTWLTPEDSRIVTIPLGYGDGISRRLSSKGSVLIRGKKYPIAGTICMDQFMVNLGPDGEAYNGDTVTIIGSDGDQEISVLDIASIIEAEPLEVLTSLNSRLPRQYLSKNNA